MSKKISVFGFFAIVISSVVILSGCGDDTALPASVDRGGAEVFPLSGYDGSQGILMGDVMPFYDGELMNIYHLKQTRGSNSLYYHPISRLVTSDFVNFTDMGVAINFEESASAQDAALGTGSFIKDIGGTYHCFYTGHNGAKNTGLKFTEGIRHATSKDNQKTWVKDEAFTLYGSENDFRDPYVYYDAETKKYNMLVTTRVDNWGVIKRYSASSLSATAEGWQDMGVFFKNDAGDFNMECPSYIEYNGYWYLMFSEQGDNRVTHYRYRESRDGDWKKFETDNIDATGFYAGRLEKMKGKLYAFAWCAKLTGGATGAFDWAGNLVTHEITQLSNGRLVASMPENVKNTFSKPVVYKDINGNAVTDYIPGKGFGARGIQKLSENITRITFDISVSDYVGDFGITFGLDDMYNNRLGSSVIAFDVKKSAVTLYNDVSSSMYYGSPLASMPFTFVVGERYGVDIIIDGEIYVVYVGGRIAVTGRAQDMCGYNFALYCNNAKAKMERLTFYE